MLLIGRYGSPFVRRVAISLKLLGLPFDVKAASTVQDRAEVEGYNPLGRVPALVLDDGEVLIDSTAILDFLDELAGPGQALVPAAGPQRRQVLKLVALAVGAMEKGLSCYVERAIRPADKQHQALLTRFGQQALAGLAALEQGAGDGWLWGDRITQADVSTVVAMDFLRLTYGEILPVGRFPKLEGLRQRAMDLSAFAETAP